jgi:hypothetical protein
MPEETRICWNNSNEDPSKRCVKGPDPQPLSAFRNSAYGSKNRICTACFVHKKSGRGIEGDLANVPDEPTTKTRIVGRKALRRMIDQANEARDVIKTKPPSVG